MHYSFNTSGTCSARIDFDIEDNKIKNVQFLGGCNGNTKGISALVEGQEANEVAKRLKGIKCGFKNTSCPDQLAQAIETALCGKDN